MRVSLQSKECEDQPKKRKSISFLFSNSNNFKILAKGYSSYWQIILIYVLILGLKIGFQIISIKENFWYLLTGNYQPEIFEED